MDAERVRQVKFRQTLRGYQVNEVDGFLERLATEIEAGRSVGGLCRQVHFRQALRGYRVDDVDHFLAEVAGGEGSIPHI